MLFRRFFQRARTHSSGDSKKRTCLCTGAKRDSLYDDIPETLNRSIEPETNDRYGFLRSDKSRRLMRQANLDESDGDDDMSITEKLRRASSECPANIPMLVVVSFNPDAKGLLKNQIEIQRGYPVNAQFILNEWLFVKTADNEEGFVPYVCCRPMLRRQSLKQSQHIDIEHSYKPYNFESNSISIHTPSTNKKLSLSSALGSQSLSRHQDITSSSCGGDSGFSDCESSSHHHNHYRSFDLSLQRLTRSSNIRSLRTLSHAWKKQHLMVQDLPSMKSNKINHSHTNLLKSDSPLRIRSKLSISSNSAFTQFVKRNSQEQDSSTGNVTVSSSSAAAAAGVATGQRLSSNSNHRHFYQRQDISPGSSSISHFRRSTNSCDDHGKSPSTLSSPYIRRTPFSRRSLPHHLQPVLKKSLKPVLSASPDPFQTIKKEEHLRHIVRAEPAILPAIEPMPAKLERHFSDLSLNQIENDSLKPSSTPNHFNRTRPSLSSSLSSGSSSSASSSSSTSDDSSTAFVHIHMNHSRCHLIQRGESIPFVFTTTNMNNHPNSNLNTSNSSTSFIHNVSITV